ncbi:response regulator transcription factor [Phytomonospora sp. NPDC050363]|uniref:response regulator transcription factor n=1 Tax=Phytomonospora sp. NPDC050363 TaxID=3155642 RepID=UPI0033D0DD25
MTISVLLADDQTLVRSGFRALLNRDRGIAVVAEAGTGDEAVRLTRAHNPDVVLMDINMPGMDGLTATERILADPATSASRVIILTTFDTDEHVFAALRIGASGFLGKETEPAELRHAVKVVAAGEALLAPGVTRRVIARFAGATGTVTAEDARLDALTAREREVMRLVATGLDNAQIARDLVISPLTAKTHVTRVLGKLGLRDRAQLVILAYESGLVRVGG